MFDQANAKTPSKPMQDRLGAESYSQPVAPESEISYAARQAAESLARLQKSVHYLAGRLEMVLTPECPQPCGPETGARAVQSRIGGALMSHTADIDSLERFVSSLSERVAL